MITYSTVQSYLQIPFFPAYVLFSDEAYLTRVGIFNAYNAHVLAEENRMQYDVVQTRLDFRSMLGSVL